MKNCLLINLVVFVLTISAEAQSRRPLKGSGKIVSKDFLYNNFDKIELKDLNGEVTVKVGEPFAINVAIDDNLQALLGAEVNDGKLTIQLKGNTNNRMYIESTNIKIRISIPEISAIQHSGNSDLSVSGLTGRYFRLQQSGNGDVVLKGTIDELDLNRSGNGDLYATSLSVRIAKINSSGNGDVEINVSERLSVNASGNGDIINKGAANFEVGSKSGNGDLKRN